MLITTAKTLMFGLGNFLAAFNKGVIVSAREPHRITPFLAPCFKPDLCERIKIER